MKVLAMGLFVSATGVVLSGTGMMFDPVMPLLVRVGVGLLFYGFAGIVIFVLVPEVWRGEEL